MSPAQLLEADSYARLLGIRLVPGSGPEVAVEMEVLPSMTNFLGVAHGGAVFSLADCAFSLISNAPGPKALAIDTHMVLTAPARVGDRLRADAAEINRGRRLATYRVMVTRGDGKTVAAFTGTVCLPSDG